MVRQATFEARVLLQKQSVLPNSICISCCMCGIYKPKCFGSSAKQWVWYSGITQNGFTVLELLSGSLSTCISTYP